MIKAGLIGWLRVLPIGEVALPGWATLVITLGLLTALGGVAVGLTQRNPKANLAYSSVSQMGLMMVLVGVALAVPDGAELSVAAAGVYALHHGLAKGALFLGVGHGGSRPPRCPGRSVRGTGSAGRGVRATGRRAQAVAGRRGPAPVGGGRSGAGVGRRLRRSDRGAPFGRRRSVTERVPASTWDLHPNRR
jgi:hypothetical protein